MTLQELLNQARSNFGNNLDVIGTKFNLPEMNLSERSAGAPTVNTGKTIDQRNMETQGILASAKYQREINQGIRNPDGSIKGSGNDNKGGTGGDTGGGGETNEQRMAREAYERKRNSIMSKLQMMKDEAGRQRGAAKQGYDFTTGEIEKNYGKLKNLNTEKLIEALQTIGQTEGDVQQIYSQTGGNARRAMESALTRNRMLYRALGALGSSFYANAQSNTASQGANAVADADLEEAQKLSAIGTQKATTSTDYGLNEVAIGSEENALKDTALTDYNNALANADLLERNYNIDSTEAIDEAESKLNSALESIQKYTGGGYKATADTAATQATNGAAANYAKNYDYTAAMKDTINKNSGINSANNTIASLNQQGTAPAGGVSTPSVLDTMVQKLKNKNKKPEDATGYFQNFA